MNEDYLYFLLESILKVNIYKLDETTLNSSQRKEIEWIKGRMEIE